MSVAVSVCLGGGGGGGLGFVDRRECYRKPSVKVVAD